MSFNYFVLLGNKITLFVKTPIYLIYNFYLLKIKISITIYLLLQWLKKNKLTQRKISLKILRVKVQKKKIGRDMEILLVLMIIMKMMQTCVDRERVVSHTF